MVARPAVVKVGGSLFDLADLGSRLRHFLAALEERIVLIVPGGGQAADAVRDLDRRHGLGEEASHWLALRALTLNAHFLAELLAPAEVIPDPRRCLALAGQGTMAILDGHAFARRDERDHPDRALPRRWSATSDALAARVAINLAAGRLILLKSVSVPPEMDWEVAARMGWVDETFPEVIARAGPGLTVEVINLREWE